MGHSGMVGSEKLIELCKSALVAASKDEFKGSRSPTPLHKPSSEAPLRRGRSASGRRRNTLTGRGRLSAAAGQARMLIYLV